MVDTNMTASLKGKVCTHEPSLIPQLFKYEICLSEIVLLKFRSVPTIGYLAFHFISKFYGFTFCFSRYLAICYTFNFKMKWKTSKFIMCAVWIFSLVISIPMALFYQRYLQRKTIYVCGEIWPSKIFEKVYFTGICVFCYAIPLVLIIICYSLIGFRVWNRNAPGVYKSNGVIHKSKVKAVKMLSVVVVLFLFSWLPLYIIKFWIYFKMDENTDLDYIIILNNYIVPVAQWLGLSNSGINPIIYCLFSRKIRIRIKMMVKCCSYRFYDYNATSEMVRQTKRFSSTRYFSVDYSNGHVTLRPHGAKTRRKSGSRKQNNIYD